MRATTELAPARHAAYRAPELASLAPGGVVDERADAFSFGALGFAMAFRAPPRIAAGRGVAFPPGTERDHAYSGRFLALLRAALCFAVGDRPAMAELGRKCQMLEG